MHQSIAPTHLSLLPKQNPPIGGFCFGNSQDAKAHLLAPPPFAEGFRPRQKGDHRSQAYRFAVPHQAGVPDL
jgi:hypothetical protein